MELPVSISPVVTLHITLWRNKEKELIFTFMSAEFKWLTLIFLFRFSLLSELYSVGID